MVEISTTSSTGIGRVSHHINRKPAGNFWHAIRIAAVRGYPLNIHVTINFALAACGQLAAAEAFENIRATRFGPWTRRPPRHLNRHADPCAFVWFFENSGSFGLHWLLHVPEDRLADFELRLPLWLAEFGIDVTTPGVVQIDEASNPRGLGQYMLKGTDPTYAPFYGVRHVAQGCVEVKRSGFSRSLGPSVKARLREMGRYKRPGFHPFPQP